MNFLTEFIQFLVLVPSAILCLLPMKNQLVISVRKLVLIGTALLLVVITVCAYLAAITNIPTNAILLPAALFLFAGYQKLLKTHFYVNISVFLLVMALMSFPANISLAIDCQLHPYENSTIHCMTCNLFQLAFSFFFVFLFGYIFWHFFSQLIDKIDSARVWIVTLPVPLIFTLLNILMRPHKYETILASRVYQMYLCYLCLAFFLLVVIYVIFYMVAMELLRNARNEERIRLFEMQESQYYAQQRYITETSRQRHDFRQQLLSMAAMAQNQEYTALTEYLSGYLSTMPETVTTYCTNVPVNALLNYYAAFMEQEQIKCNWKISLPSELHITDTELCSLLGNLLENVCHGCKTLPNEERFHSLTIQMEHGNCLYIVSSNSFDGVVKQKNTSYLPTQKGGSGIGLSSIAAIADKYQGIAQFSHTGREFISNIVLINPASFCAEVQ